MSQHWLRTWSGSQKAPIRLFCFPYAGGGANVFQTWSAGLWNAAEVLAIELPGRGRRFSAPLETQVGSLVEGITTALLPYLDKPYAMFGHSLGALLAFEVARHVKHQNQPEPRHLMVSGRDAPHWPNPTPPIHHLPDAEFIAAIRRYNGTPEAVLANPELLDLFLPVLRADFKLAEAYDYTPGPNLSCPITVYGGTEDDHTTPDGLGAWQQLTDGPFNSHLFEGDHFFLQTQQKTLLTEIYNVYQRNHW